MSGFYPTYHVLPVDDLKPHNEAGTSRWCKPRIEYEPNGGGGYSTIVIHNSMDGREKFETGERKAS